MSRSMGWSVAGCVFLILSLITYPLRHKSPLAPAPRPVPAVAPSIAPPQSPAAPPLPKKAFKWGLWTNAEPTPGNLTKLLIGPHHAHAWGDCDGRECDWGEGEHSYFVDENKLVVLQEASAIRRLQISALDGRVHVSIHTHFVNSGSTDRDDQCSISWSSRGLPGFRIQ